MKDELLELIKRDTKQCQRMAQYRILTKNVRYMFRQAKDEWFNDKYAELKMPRDTDTAGRHKMMNEITGYIDRRI